MDKIIFYPVTLTLEFETLLKKCNLANNFWTVKSFNWYQNMCTLWSWPSLELALIGEFVFHKHILFLYDIVKTIKYSMSGRRVCSWYNFMIKVCVYFGTCTSSFMQITIKILHFHLCSPDVLNAFKTSLTFLKIFARWLHSF